MLEHDSFFLSGKFWIRTVESCGLLSSGNVLFEFNAVFFVDDSFPKEVPAEFKSIKLSTEPGPSIGLECSQPLWFINCRMHCDMRYLDLNDDVLPGSKMVHKSCYYCPTVGTFLDSGQMHVSFPMGSNPFREMANTSVNRQDGFTSVERQENPFWELSEQCIFEDNFELGDGY